VLADVNLVQQVRRVSNQDLKLTRGHFAWMTASDKFLEALVSKVRPVVIVRGA